MSFSRVERSVLAERFIVGTEFTIDGVKTPNGHYTMAISEKNHFAHNESIANELLFSHYNPNFDYDKLRATNDAFVMKSNLQFGFTHAEYKFEDFTAEGYFIAIGSDTTKFVRVGDKKDADSYSVIYAYSNAELFPNGFNNQFLVKCIPLIYIAFVFAFFLLAAITGLRYWFFAVVYAFLSRSLTAIIKVQITFKDAIHLCFYAQTIAILLTNMNTAVGYMVYPTFASIIGVIITVVVIHKAVRPHMPSLDELMNNMKGNDFFK